MMKDKGFHKKNKQLWLWAILPTICALLTIIQMTQPQSANASSSEVIRRVNVPYDATFTERAIFWFGHVDTTSNYANVRIGYDDDEIIVHLHIFDRLLWYDTSPTPETLTAWDTATLYLALDGNMSSMPTASSYRFVAQSAPPWQSRPAYQAAYQGNGTDWNLVPVNFTSTTGWRGEGFNNNDNDRGWWVRFNIPFTTLGLTARPTPGVLWGLGLALHDRDDLDGSTIPDQVWPETMVGQNPATWGELHFGQPSYAPPLAGPGTETIIRQTDSITVMDAHVGGHTTCGSGLAHWQEWGEANYAGYAQVNVQNQADVSDWPCYSRYYVTFPLDAIPTNKVIRSAQLTLFQFGNAGQGWNPDPEPSLIQVMTVAEEWDEMDITWNNSPLAAENFSATWVDPLDYIPPWPGVPIEWDVSRAAAIAYEAGIPLRLALFSADSAYHSGRYFYSSDAGEAGRPMLEIEWAESLEVIARLYLPFVQHNE